MSRGQPRPTGAYADALERERKQGSGACDDAAAMAGYCRNILQIMVGAASPQLVWEGAQAKGMTLLELARLAGDDPLAVHELMWVTS